jgi:Arginase family
MSRCTPETRHALIESGAVRGDRFLQVGLRGYWPEPPTLDWTAARRMRSYEMTEIVTRGLEECLTEAFAVATDECDGVFLSVDIDVCDPGHAPGTGTPEPGGLSARQLLDSVRRITYELPLVGMDVVDVSPPYDQADITSLLANRVILEALSGMARRRTGPEWDPAPPLLDGRCRSRSAWLRGNRRAAGHALRGGQRRDDDEPAHHGGGETVPLEQRPGCVRLSRRPRSPARRCRSCPS